MKEETEEVVCEILQYLTENPHAQDTVEGIARWWISEQTIRKRRGLVEKALATLVAEDLVIARKGPDTQTVYKINDQRREKIETFRHDRCEDHTIASSSQPA
jgi:hypothetical protein